MGCGASSTEATTQAGSTSEASIPINVVKGRKGEMNFSLLVIGGTGLIGREVVRQALQQQWRVRVATLHKKNDMCRIMSAMGAEIFHIEQGNRGTMVAAAAMQDAAIFIPPFLESDFENARMWIDALAVSATVGRVVFWSLAYNLPPTTSIGRYRQLVRDEFQKNNQSFQKGWAEVASSLTMQGWLKHWMPSIVQQKVHSHPFRNTKFAWIDASNVAQIMCLLVLPFQRSHGQTVVLRGKESFSHQEGAEIVGSALQIQLPTADLTVDDWARNLEKNAGCVQEFVAFCDNNPEECAQVDESTFSGLSGEELKPFRQFVSQQFKPAMMLQDVRSFI